jgi:hypothetical protein
MIRHTDKAKRKISRNRIIRSVASSSAIDTGESTENIEKRLKSRSRRRTSLTLAF